MIAAIKGGLLQSAADCWVLAFWGRRSGIMKSPEVICIGLPG